jgi:hypothetical protein
VGDLAFMPGAEQKTLAASSHVTAAGRYVLVDREAGWAPADALVFDEREPNLLEHYFSYDVDPVRTLRTDPWAAWELRAQWEQTPNPPPDGAPSSLEQLRIAHNIALAQNDPGLAQALEAKVVGNLDRGVAMDFPDGTKLLGGRYVPGVAPKLELYFVPPDRRTSTLLTRSTRACAAPALGRWCRTTKPSRRSERRSQSPRRCGKPGSFTWRAASWPIVRVSRSWRGISAR